MQIVKLFHNRFYVFIYLNHARANLELILGLHNDFGDN